MAGRMRQPIDVSALEKYLLVNEPRIKIPLDVKQFGFGQSNPTYQLTSPDGSRYVLRKKPPGKLLSRTAHKVEREHRIINALGPTDVPVPKAYLLCTDESVLGTPFYIMEFLDGRIFEDPALPEVSAEERTQLWKAAVETLARFHRVDFRRIGLQTFGRPEGFYDRQIATWKQICTSQAQTLDADTKTPVGKMPHFDELLEYFSDKKLQPKDRATLVHGDYKLDNMVFHKTQPEVIGILDWEMSTVGHPLSDLANILNGFYTVSIRPKYISDAFMPGVTPGLPSPEDILTWYSEVAGWDPRPDLNWAMGFSIFRSSAISQGIAARVAQRQATSEQAMHYVNAFKPLGELAWKMVEKDRKEVDGKAKL